MTVETREPARSLAGLAGVHDLVIDGMRATLSVDSDAIEGVVAHLAGLGVTALVSKPPTLEELFLRHYGYELDDAGVSTPWP